MILEVLLLTDKPIWFEDPVGNMIELCRINKGRVKRLELSY
jgi:hypothetical protein